MNPRTIPTNNPIGFDPARVSTQWPAKAGTANVAPTTMIRDAHSKPIAIGDQPPGENKANSPSPRSDLSHR